MKTLRSMIDSFVWDHFWQFEELIDREGEDAMLHGIRAMDDPGRMVHGTLANTTSALYAHYAQTGDPRAEITFERLKKFLDMTSRRSQSTFGKMNALKALNRIPDRLGELDPAIIERLKVVTDYADFYDKKELHPIGLPSNYMQVAMSCAAFREKFGWENDGISDAIAGQLVRLMAEGSQTGWMDEAPPYGRFDRYTLLNPSEVADSFEQVGKPVPDLIRRKLKDGAEAMIFAANRRGDGINYGRSLASYGDGAALEIIASAFACGLIDESLRDRAVAYSLHLLDKLLNFWFDRKRRSLNMWWDGRKTNNYRNVGRILEANLGMAMHIVTVLHNFELAGLADYAPARDLENPETWEAQEIVFIDRPDQQARTIVLRRGDTMSMLPLIGLGSWHSSQSYMPFPAICRNVEGASDGVLPFLVPEYALPDGRAARPIQYFDSIETLCGEDCVTVTAKGFLCIMGEHNPEKSDRRFTSVYRFCGRNIEVEFTADGPFEGCRMLAAVQAGGTKLEGVGFDSSETIDPADPMEFHTPHGPQAWARMYHAYSAARVGYRVALADMT